MALAVRTLGAATIAAASGGGNLSPFKVQIPKPIATREGLAQAGDAADRRFNDTSAGPGRAVCVQARRPHRVRLSGRLPFAGGDQRHVLSQPLRCG